MAVTGSHAQALLASRAAGLAQARETLPSLPQCGEILLLGLLCYAKQEPKIPDLLPEATD